MKFFSRIYQDSRKNRDSRKSWEADAFNYIERSQIQNHHSSNSFCYILWFDNLSRISLYMRQILYRFSFFSSTCTFGISCKLDRLTKTSNLKFAWVRTYSKMLSICLTHSFQCLVNRVLKIACQRLLFISCQSIFKDLEPETLARVRTYSKILSNFLPVNCVLLDDPGEIYK